jgi:RNA polymerase sigma-70 factor (sigma-E family)
VLVTIVGGSRVNQHHEEEFRAFVAARVDRWRRAAFLLCHDWHAADDLVAIAIARIFRQWRRIDTVDNPDAYAQRALTSAFLDERRRPWRRERPVDVLPEAASVHPDRISDRAELLGWLAQLAPRQRAVVVLRFYFDQSVEETARLLAISEGTVKSQAARGLEHLRALASGSVR